MSHHQSAGSERRSGALTIVKRVDPPRFWRSLEARSRSPELIEASKGEFPQGADQLADEPSRRSFMQLVGASTALVGAAACQRPNQKIYPYVRRPPEVTPGNPLHFATAYSLEGYARGLVVESHGGRPTKIEGNSDHPDSLGATTALDQALILGLYDDNRARQITHRREPGLGPEPAAWRSILVMIAERSEKLAQKNGAGLRFLVDPSASPLQADLRARLSERFPQAKFVAFSAVAAEGAALGNKLAFGRPLETRHDLAQAQVILALDADFLGDGPEQVKLSRQFGASRTPGPAMSRLYVAEPCFTPTGMLADHRLRLRGSEILALAQALVVELAKQPGLDGLAPLAGLPRAAASVDARWVAALAKDLARTRGKCAIIAGRRQPAAVHALAAAMNSALRNVGATVNYATPLAIDGGVEALRGLVEDIAAGTVDTLVITAKNPVFGAPADFKFDKLLARVPLSIYCGMAEDETSAAVTTFVPVAHSLESWGDGRALDGTVSIIQPLIHPLWSQVTDTDVTAAFLGEGDKGSHDLLTTFWKKRAIGSGWATDVSFDGLWESWLAKGVVDRTAAQPESGLATNPGALAGALAPLVAKAVKGDSIEIGFAVCPKVFDGRYANNAWLQELPHPVTKITWDNAVLMSKATAARLNVETGDVVRIEAGDRHVTGPAYIQPGHADEAVTVALGYGRTVAGKLAKGVGFNAAALRDSASPWFARGVNLARTSRTIRFGITQDHWDMEGRDPVIVATLAEFHKEGSHVNEKLEQQRRPLETIHEPVDYSQQPYKWAMAIDLSKCSGCNACVVACVSENNIPIVGRENVRIGREMQWLRLDRYYEGPVEDPEVVVQPVMCMHCEAAPCEYVCPVNATVHSDEGLNEMVYNRCVGTRYCNNNCPYKVRRFNFLDYHKEPSHVDKMATNPDVTVRSRGIMEKCTYCVQRIERKRIDARVEGRKIADGEIVTACQQVCPTGAIDFGSLNDPGARVTALHADPRRYNLLHEIGTRPRTAYLARIRNPNPELA